MMEISDAVELFQQYLLVEKGLSKQTIDSYTKDIKLFLDIFSREKENINELSQQIRQEKNLCTCR